MSALFEEPATHRLKDGSLVTRASSRVEWAQVSRTGKVHHIKGVVIRWNFMGGTREKPDVTFVLTCGPQNHTIYPVYDPTMGNVCARCDRHAVRLASSSKSR